MNKKSVEWLYQELPDLIKKGVLTQETANNLKTHYGEIKPADKKWFMFFLYGLAGTILIGLGIILLFAHNWDQLSRSTRAVLSFMPLLIGQALVFWVLFKKPTSGIFKECSATFLSLMVGASIALVCQTYNIPGNAASFTLTWMFLIVPLVYLMQATIPAAIYCIGITAWAMQIVWNDPLRSMLFWPLIAVIVPHFIWSLRQEKYIVRATMLSFVMMICVLLGAQWTLEKSNNWPSSWIIIGPCLFTLFYLVGSYKFKNSSTNWQRPLLRIGALGIFIHAFFLTFRFSWDSISSRYPYYYKPMMSGLKTLPGSIISILIVTTAILLFYDFAKRRQLMKAMFGGLSVLAVIAYFLTAMGAPKALAMFLFNAYLFILSLTRIILGAKSNRLDIVNTGMFMLATLILARFFDSDINFILKGTVFILIGIGFLLTNVMMLRKQGVKNEK
jgi:uncharacterized membrane protein